MKINNLFVILALLIIGCKKAANEKNEIKSVIAEKKIEGDIYINNQSSKENLIYIPNRKFITEYTYTKDSVDYFYKKDGDDWQYVVKDSIEYYPNAITNITTVVPNVDTLKKSQTTNLNSLTYYFGTKDSIKQAGVIENQKNIWLYPPRQDLFKILEFNPFPYVKFPLQIGNTWSTFYTVSYEQDDRWEEWIGSLKVLFSYKVIDYERINTRMGQLDCYVISSTGKSRIGNTKSTAYFHKEYGFVRIDYNNIDGSTLQLRTLDKEKIIEDEQFAKDNIIFPLERKYTFEYTYTKDNVEFLYEYTEGSNNWNLVPVNSVKDHPNTVTSFNIEVPKTNLLRRKLSDYDQTTIIYKYNPIGRTSKTGVIEDTSELFVHPPRQAIFKILEFSPFPKMKLPVEIGETWKSSITTEGKYWGGDKRWNEWEGTKTFYSSFEVTGTKIVDTPMGKLKCYVLKAKTESDIGNAKLTGYFNEKYGFVLMDYLNIDRSSLQLRMIKTNIK